MVTTNHADEEPWLLSSAPYTSITDNTNSETSRKTRETDRETGTELYKALEEGHLHSHCNAHQRFRPARIIRDTYGCRR